MKYASFIDIKNFIEGNARKINAVFLGWLLCDVIKSRNDHGHMLINDPLARPGLSSYVPPKATFGNITTLFEKKEKERRNSFSMNG